MSADGEDPATTPQDATELLPEGGDSGTQAPDAFRALASGSGDAVKVGNFTQIVCADDEPNLLELRQEVEPWLSALFQSEHLSLLIGSGLTISVSDSSDTDALDMGKVEFGLELEEEVNRRASTRASEMGRGRANIEDQIRAADVLLEGLETLGAGNVSAEETGADQWREALNRVLSDFARSILDTEEGIRSAVASGQKIGLDQLVSFLLAFSSRLPSRDRLHIFTTNYDRVLEWGCDEAGIKILDQFVGHVQPRFRASRLNLDYHYNPPGIRGEPRYVEGVTRLTKLHGSVDWVDTIDGIVRVPVPFGPPEPPPQLPNNPLEALMIYPNASKEIETSFFPYSELLRDFSAAICRPNSVLVTYGYGFGDSHVNRVIRDMLAIPSTHLVALSYSRADGRISDFLADCKRGAQTSFIVGSRVASLDALVDFLLPKPSIDLAQKRKAKLQRDRGIEPAQREIGGGAAQGAQDSEARNDDSN